MEMVFNKEKALKRTMGDSQLLSELLDFSLQDLDDQISFIRGAFDRNDRQLAREEAHKLKGTVGAICADQLFQRIFSLEQNALDAKPEELEVLLSEVEQGKDLLLAHQDIIELRGAPQRP